MNLSLALISALLFLFPGFCCFVGFVFGGRMDRLSAVPDLPPQSSASLSIIVGGSLLAHLAGSGLFFYQDYACKMSGVCWEIAYDPNIYRAIIERDTSFVANEGAIFFTLLGLVVLGVASAWAASGVSRSDTIQDFFSPDRSNVVAGYCKTGRTPGSRRDGLRAVQDRPQRDVCRL